MDPVPPVVVPAPKPKTNILVWIVGGIVILSVGIGIGLFLAKNIYPPLQILSTPTPSPIIEVPPADPTVNWKTYKASGFVSFKHPAEWEIKPVFENDYHWNVKLIIPSDYNETVILMLTSYDNPKNLSLDTFERDSQGSINSSGEAKLLPIGNTRGFYRDKCSQLEVSSLSLRSCGDYYVAAMKDQVIKVSVYVPTENYKIIIDQILSTFRFVEQNVAQ